jgi:hypothetical protein
VGSSVELLAAAIRTIPLDRPDKSDPKPMVITIGRPIENPATHPTSAQTDLINACPSCAAGICACFARVSVNRDEIVLCSCSRHRLLRFVVDGISPPQARPYRAAQSFMILLQARQVLIRVFHRFWPQGSDPRNPALLAI